MHHKATRRRRLGPSSPYGSPQDEPSRDQAEIKKTAIIIIRRVVF